MKINLWALALIALLFSNKVLAQDTIQNSIPSVERSIKGIQVGETGLVFNYEFKLSNKIALRTEAGYTIALSSKEYNFWTGEKENGSTAALPSFTVEPRWYYNLNRRMRKGNDIKGNRANYFSLMANYCVGGGAIKFDNRMDDFPDFIVVTPMWGMRRTIGKHLNYELGAGIGYGYVSKYKHSDHSHRADEGAMVFLRARFGFDF